MRKLLIFLLLLLAGATSAQNCTGSLGDPVLNVTFGAGTPQFGPALTSGITTMTYLGSGCAPDGDYQIVNRMTTCNTSTWYPITRDHTGDPGGYFMLVNANLTASDFYVQQVDGLCDGTTYQFSAWAFNLCHDPASNLPNITFSIETTSGTQLATFSSGNINISGAWQQYPFNFTIPPGISSVVLRMTNNAPGGNGNDLLLDDITFRPVGPAITATIAGVTGTSITVCSDATNNLSLTSLVNSCFATPAYQWQVSTDNAVTWTDIPGATSLTYTRTPTAAGTYLYRLMVGTVNNISSLNCRTASSILTVNVNPAYPVSVSISASPTAAACTGSTVTFTATPTNGGIAPTYQWYLNNNPVGFNGTTYANSSFVTGDIVKCMLTSSYPCTTPATSNTITMAVNPPVTPTVSIVASSNTICAGSPATFTATPVNGGTSPTYQWLVNGVADASSTSAVYTTSSLANNDMVQCILTSSLGCASPATSNIITMTVNAIVTPTVTIVSSMNNVCSTTPITFTATPVNGGTTPAYQWLVNGNPMAGANSSTYTTTTLANNDVVSCVLTSSYACVSSPTATSNSITMIITPQVTLSVTITADTTAICKNDPVTFTATAVNSGTTTVYQWQVNGVNAGTNSNTFTTIALNDGDKITCIVTGNDRCAANASATSNVIIITVYPLPVIVMEQGVTIFNGTSVPLTPEVYGTISSYLWTPATGLDNNKIQNPIATPDTTTTYTFKVTTDHNCEAQSSITIKVLRAIKIPNIFSPNGDGINDTWRIEGLEEYSGCTVDVYNRYGQRVYHSLDYNTPWDGTYNGKPLPLATYYYIIDPKNGIGVLSGYIVIIR